MKCIFIALTLFLSNCSPYPDLAALSDPEKLESMAMEPGLYLESRALEAPDAYGVMLSWNLDHPVQEGMSLFRTEAGKRVFLGHVDSQKGQRWDATLKSDTLYHYEIVGSDGLAVFERELRTARDLIVRGTVHLPEDYATISRLFFEDSAVLVTGGIDVQWSLNEMHGATGARLVSFLKDAPARAKERARDSGKAQIFVRKASSVLQIEWRGETGYFGAHGAANPKSGANGRDGAGSTMYGRHGMCRRGGDGGPGGTGPAGSPGKAGGNGGDAQSFEISVLYPSKDFTVLPLIEAGAAGRGGKGGKGGPGGRGGKGGSGGMECEGGSSGHAGSQGRTGAPGGNGKPGLVTGEICILMNNEPSCSKASDGIKSSP